MILQFQVACVLCWVGTKVLYIIKKNTLSVRLNFVYSVIKLQIMVHDMESSVQISLFIIIRLNKGNHYGRNLCHFCSANHGWLRELNAASHALVGRTWQGYQT